MCTDLRLVRLADLHVSGRTLDFAFELGSSVRIVPRGQAWSAIPTSGGAPSLTWTNDLGFVAMDGFGFDTLFADGLNEAGLSVGTLWLPETRLPATPPTAGDQPALDFVNLAGWLLGSCRTVADVKAALDNVQIWNPPVRDLWPTGRPVPAQLAPLMDWAFTEHLAVHDAHGGDLVIEFLEGGPRVHDNPNGVLTNSPTFDWHITNLRNYIGLTNAEDQPYNLMGMPVKATGSGSGLIGLPGDVTPPSRFVRATVLGQISTEAANAREALNQVFHALDLVSVPRNLAASGDYTQWYVARDHDRQVYYVRSYDAWTTDAHDLRALGVDAPGPMRTVPLPAATA
jgi:choloylglycine hydrolase